MTPVLVFAHSVLAAGWLATGFYPEGRARGGRILGIVGVALAAVTVVARDSLDPWRSVELAPGPAAVAGVAIACAWALVMALDLGESRWWTGALTGVACTGLLLVAGAQWVVPALLFLVCLAVPTYVVLARSGAAGWPAAAVGDAAIAAALVSAAVVGDTWELPHPITGGLAVPLLVGAGLRLGLIPRAGASLRSPGAALAPISAGLGFVILLRVAERPEPVAAAALLTLGVGVAGWTLLRRTIDPHVVAMWPVATSAGFCLASPAAGTSAAVAGILGLSVVVLWPDALERGRLSRGLLLSGVVPNVGFGALAAAATAAFAASTADGPLPEIAAWNLVSGLLPIVFAAGLALGAVAARVKPAGGYHPEAVLVTWLLLGASVVAGALLGPEAVYAPLGGRSAAILFAVALTVGGVVASRTGATVDAAPGRALVEMGHGPSLPGWSRFAIGAVHAVALGAVSWVTVAGLRVGFL